MSLYNWVCDKDGKLWVEDQWGSRHEPAPVEHRTHWLPMWDPDYYNYTTDVEWCPHITLHYAEGWAPQGDEDEWIHCPEPTCVKSKVEVLNDDGTMWRPNGGV